MSVDTSERIWNRAADFSSPDEAEFRGDAALHRVLVFHGSVMNGGLFEAVRSYAHDEEYPLEAVTEAFGLLGAENVVGVVEAAEREIEELREEHDDEDEDDESQAVWEEAEERVNGRYPLDDTDLERLLEAALIADPELFAPVAD
ncbi:DMP19 family protein [Mycetocola reblochoni]|uniref:DNA mimic protein DMP19 C-terminal domain-containing protein n=2 Tax=Mycetocola reblochoni TaxID=331618 RepID=A0A1R4K4B5_9MICO|nr:hypothetical protein [Mycetocola reblochoni]RLP69886.1 hypothetical protein D9V30_04145 [Mycetocola reblochoni]SJN39032.1 hypothetical protein FM119_11255 [Mycetocola reblochoni REB411]